MMLRGFRWQFLVLVMALVLFVAALASRSTEPDQPNVVQPAPTKVATSQTTTATLAPTAAPPTANIKPDLNNTPAPVVTYREALVGSVQRLNPLFTDLNPVDRDISSLIFEGLTRSNQYGEPEPALAQNWVISSDGLEYVIRLRQGVLWQDGMPFKAADVIYTYSLLQSPDFPGSATMGAFWRTVEVEALDNYLVRFRLTQPLGSFLDMLRLGILPEHALLGTTAAQIATHPFNLTPIGTGPYQLEALRAPDGKNVQMVDLRLAPVYRQRPEGQTGYQLDRVSFKLYSSFDEAVTALKAGDVDGLAARNRYERPALTGIGGLNVHTTLEPTVGMLIFNWASDKTKFFREQRVRQALQMGLDRTSIIQRYLLDAAIKADSPIFPGSWAYTAELPWPNPDAAAAKKLLESANIPKDKAEATAEPTATGSLSFRILTPDDPALANIAQEIAAQWAQLNVTVSVDSVDLKTYQERLDKSDFDTALVELSLGSSADPDVYHFWDPGQYPDGPNYGGVDERHIAEELERARRDPSGINRAIHYQNFQRDFISRAIAIPLYYPLYTYATSSKVSGVQLGFMGSPTNRFDTIRDWDIKAS
jgi:peptide/nickel transport system substrate-binding protein